MAHGIKEIAIGVGYLPVSIANVYFVGSHGGPWALVDTSLPGKGRVIRAAAEARFGPGTRPEAIVLTHGHADHSGSALELAEYWDVPIYAHRMEMPYLTGKSMYPPPDPTAPGFMGFLTRLFKPQPMNLGDRVRIIDGPEIPGMPGWEWRHTPGHAPGEISLFRPLDATVIAGDTFTTVNLDSLFDIVTKRQRVSRPPTPVNYDWKAARESVRLVASLKPFTLACGHGIPMKGNMATLELANFARDFPIPRHGRYVNEPARVDESGIVWLPPEPPDRLPKIAAGVGAAAVAGTAAVVIAKRRGRGL